MKNIPYGRQNIDQIDIDAVVETLQSDFLTQGPKIAEFEEKFAAYVNAKHVIAVSNATVALHLAMMALNLKENERIITTPNTFVASANCARYVGAEVWFADIDPKTFLLDLDKTKKLIESKPEGFFKGIVVVDFAGLMVNLEQFSELCKKHNLWLVEDACHAPGASFIDSKGKQIKAGCGDFADISIFSFHPVKHIACGEGGMLTTNNKELSENLSSLRSHGIVRDNMTENHGGWYYEMQSLGYNYRMTDMQAALGITQLAKNDIGIQRRIEIAEYYKAHLHEMITWQEDLVGYKNAYHLFVIQTDQRKDLYNFLRQKNIFAQVHYIPIHTQPYYKEIGYQNADLHLSEKYYEKCLSLPMYPSLTDEELEYVVVQINNYKLKI